MGGAEGLPLPPVSCSQCPPNDVYPQNLVFADLKSLALELLQKCDLPLPICSAQTHRPRDPSSSPHRHSGRPDSAVMGPPDPSRPRGGAFACRPPGPFGRAKSRPQPPPPPVKLPEACGLISQFFPDAPPPFGI